MVVFILFNPFYQIKLDGAVWYANFFNIIMLNLTLLRFKLTFHFDKLIAFGKGVAI